MIEIENENLLKKAMESGVNIFAGAGFSVLPSPSGNSLPTGDELKLELSREFGIKSDGLSLVDVATIINSRDEGKLQKFLRKKFYVTEVNPLYNEILKTKINTFITTNIDNIMHNVIDNNREYFLHDISYYGVENSSRSKIDYIPLHGNVTNSDSHLYFSESELSTVDIPHKDLFSSMETCLRKYPTIFWGYNMNDVCVKHTVENILSSTDKQNIWILVNGSSPKIDVYRAMGLFVITGNTEEFLTWIASNLKPDYKWETNKNSTINKFLIDYAIPTHDTKLSLVSNEDFFRYAQTNWYSILHNADYQRKITSQIQDLSEVKKNVLVIGEPFSGKTVLSMRMALLDKNPNKIYLKSPTLVVSKKIIENIENKEVSIYIDDACDDIEAYITLAESANIKTIGFVDYYSYEISKHKLVSLNPKLIFIEDLDKTDTQGIFNKIPPRLKKSKEYVYKTNNSEHFSMLEMLYNNVSEFISEEKIIDFVEKIKNTYYDVLEVVMIATYLTSNKSFLSTDILFSYLDLKSYSEVINYIEKTKKVLSDACDCLSPNEPNDQDYFKLRSPLFSRYCDSIFIKNYRHDYARCIRKFILKVPMTKIFRCNIFRRTAFDSKYFIQIFGEHAKDVYDYLIKSDPLNPFIWQQAALYESRMRNFSDAFYMIDHAKQLGARNAYSLKNSYAIILFEASYDCGDSVHMKNALGILADCFYNDKRKSYHLKKYIDFALKFYHKTRDNEHVIKANELCKKFQNDKIIDKNLIYLIKELKQSLM